MEPMVVRARLRVVAAEHGRTTPIRSGYRPHFDCGATWMGTPMQSSGIVSFLDRDALAPGDEAEVRIEPMSPEFWGAVRAGSLLVAHEGSRVVAYATVLEVQRSELFTLAVGDFVWRARELCRFVEEAPAMTLDDRLAGARERLLHLFTAAIHLPDLATDEDADRDPPKLPERWQSFGEYESYRQVFDPYETHDDPVMGSLSDDLLDVHRDVQSGLGEWDRGRWSAAISTWRFTFETHWGDHAANALRALHRACVHHGL